MEPSPYRFGNMYKLANGKVQYRISGYYPSEKKVLLKFGLLPVKAKTKDLQGISLDGFLLQHYGFKADPLDNKFWQKDNVIVYLINKGLFRIAYKTQIYDKAYHYLHQLQNIYHIHTGNEL